MHDDRDFDGAACGCDNPCDCECRGPECRDPYCACVIRAAERAAAKSTETETEPLADAFTVELVSTTAGAFRDRELWAASYRGTEIATGPTCRVALERARERALFLDRRIAESRAAELAANPPAPRARCERHAWGPWHEAGRCYHRRTCGVCGAVQTIDSSD